jgi:hypothetical protein
LSYGYSALAYMIYLPLIAGTKNDSSSVSLNVINCNFTGFPIVNGSTQAIRVQKSNYTNKISLSGSSFASVQYALFIEDLGNRSAYAVVGNLSVTECSFYNLTKNAIRLPSKVKSWLKLLNSTFTSNGDNDILAPTGSSLFIQGCTFVDPKVGIARIESADISGQGYSNLILQDSVIFGGNSNLLLTMASGNDVGFVSVSISRCSFRDFLGLSIIRDTAISTYTFQDSWFANVSSSNTAIKGAVINSPVFSLSFIRCVFNQTSPSSYMLSTGANTKIGYLANWVIEDSIFDGVRCVWISSSYMNSIMIQSSQFQNILDQTQDSLIYIDVDLFQFSVDGCYFRNISSESDFSLFFTSTTWISVTNSSFISISSHKAPVLRAEWKSNIVFQGCTFANLTSQTSSGAIELVSSSCEFDGGKFWNLSAISGEGGAISLYQDSTLTVNSTTFAHTTSQTFGGAIYAEAQSVLNLFNVSFDNCQSTRGASIFMETAIAPSLQLPVFNASFCKFQNGVASMEGGALYLYGLYSITLLSSQIDSCFAGAEGGGIYVESSGSLSILSSTGRYCASSSGGGALYSLTTTANLTNCTFSDNEAMNGGALAFVQSDFVYLSSLILHQNLADKYGGGLYFSGDYLVANLARSQLSSNIAISGGAVWVLDSVNLTVEASRFITNNAIYTSTRACLETFGSGGAIFFNSLLSSNKAALISSSDFLGNSATFYGGAIGAELVDYPLSVSSVLRSNNMVNNQATYGDDVATQWTSMDVVVPDSEINLSESALLKFIFKDNFGQVGSGFNCTAEFWTSTSPANYFVTKTSTIPFSAMNTETAVSVSLVWKQNFLSTPLVNTSVSTNLSICIQESCDALRLVHFNVSLCESGYRIITSDAPEQYYQCEACSPGKFLSLQNDLLYFDCGSCASGKFSSYGATACQECQPGTMVDSLATSCLNCAFGTYSQSIAASVCQVCDIAKYSDELQQTACVDCPEHSVTSSLGSTSATDCVCPDGYFGNPYNQGCKMCNLNLKRISCPRNSSIPIVEPGFWRSPVDPSLVLECVPQISCSDTSTSAATQCSSQYTGRLCGECIGIEFQRIGGVCKRCPEMSSSIAIFVLILAVILAFFLYGITGNRVTSRGEVKLLVLWLQTMALFSRFSSKWPASIQSLLDILSVLVRLLKRFALF